MKRQHASFHITYSPPESCHTSWPNGVWALYRIDGDEIARRVKWEGGKVVHRDSWPGYIGSFSSLARLTAAIETLD